MANTAVEKGTNVNVAPALSFKSEVATVTNACVESTRQMLEDRGVKFDEYGKYLQPYPQPGPYAK